MVRQFLTWILLYFFTALSVKGCDVIGLNLCTWKLGQNVTGSNDFTVLPSGSQINKLCTYREEFKNCYKPKLEKCSEMLLYVSTFATTQKTVDFICTVGYSDMMSQDQCWKNTEVQNRSKSCYQDHVDMVKNQLQKSSTTQDILSEEAKQAWCKILFDSNACMHQSVEDYCVKPAVDVVTDMMNTVFEQMYSVMKCREPDRPVAEKLIGRPLETLLRNNCFRSSPTSPVLLLVIFCTIIIF